jgi:hypothetical protein
MASVKKKSASEALPAEREKYGLVWGPEVSDLDIELYCYREGAPDSPGKPHHFKAAVDLLWNQPTSSKNFTWHPWAEKMLEEVCKHKYLSVGGCASSGKTDFYAVWGLIEWLCAPHATQVLFTSTSLKDSRKRIWSTVEDFFQAVPGLPGKLVSSQGVIRFEADGIQSDKFGLTLVASDRKKERDAQNKFMGFKAPRLRLVADELPELADSILTTAFSNLARNEDFKMVGIGNPNSHYDPHGRFSEPDQGWTSVTENDYEWKTKYGWFIRFDAERSPNVELGYVKYPFLAKQSDLDEAAKLGEKSVAYYRMVKGFWCPSGSDDSIYSDTEIERGMGTHSSPTWSENAGKQRVAALDVAFTAGGDRCVLRFATVGRTTTNPKHIHFDEVLLITEDVTDKITPRTQQICRQVRDECIKRGVSVRNFSLDATAGGAPFADVLAVLWGPEFLRVNFSGRASDTPVSASDRAPSYERYSDRVSELWFSGKELLRTKQISGLDASTVREMVSRRYDTVKGAGKLLLRAESKVDMKDRVGFSPDLADAAFILLDLCRTRLGFASSERTHSQKAGRRPESPLKKALKRLDVAGRARRFF